MPPSPTIVLVLDLSFMSKDLSPIVSFPEQQPGSEHSHPASAPHESGGLAERANHFGEDSEKDRVVSDVLRGLSLLASNLEEANVHGGKEFAISLRNRANDIAEQTRADYEQTQENYQKARDYIAGRIVMLAIGELTGPVTIIGEPEKWARYFVRVGYGRITRPQTERLRDWVYEILGANKPPDGSAFIVRGESHFRSAETRSASGVDIVETRYMLGQLGEKRNTHEGELGELSELTIA